jgi:hypothetical protein
MSELHSSRKLLIDSVAGMSQAQLDFKAKPEAWSVAEIVEHLAMTEDMLFAQYKQLAAKAPDPEKKTNQKDEELLKFIREREQKVQAPPMVLPKKSFATVAAAMAAFKERRDRTIRFVETTQDTGLRGKIMPGFGIDSYQIFLLIGSHTARHVTQINEVKASPGYPGK